MKLKTIIRLTDLCSILNDKGYKNQQCSWIINRSWTYAMRMSIACELIAKLPLMNEQNSRTHRSPLHNVSLIEVTCICPDPRLIAICTMQCPLISSAFIRKSSIYICMCLAHQINRSTKFRFRQNELKPCPIPISTSHTIQIHNRKHTRHGQCPFRKTICKYAYQILCQLMVE